MDLTVDRGEKLRVCSCPSGRMDSLEAAAKPASRSIAIDLDGNFIPESGRGSFHIPEWGLGSRSAHVRSVYSVLPPGRNLADPFRNYTSGFSFCGSLVSLTLLLLTIGSVPRFEDTNSIYPSALRAAPDNWIAHHFYAIALWNQQRHEESLREHRLALQLAPKSPVTHEAYAAALLEVGRDDEAMTEFRSALILLPKQPRFRALILYQLAELEVKNGNYAQAIECLREAVNLDSQAMNYHLLLREH